MDPFKGIFLTRIFIVDSHAVVRSHIDRACVPGLNFSQWSLLQNGNTYHKLSIDGGTLHQCKSHFPHFIGIAWVLLAR